ncbi:anthranilate synthase component II [Kangiella shandongensis]|uniref:anthranilate synthase component II n=1 Tax=Kangiella shandongensis TaxID=2763258 RepID=UPI001CBC4F35|nr:aminodeoxychorismate/anthranilate synthase component II [Kangiella shandongensis]
MNILVIDNYDSFIYNLTYELESMGHTVVVCRNDISYETLIRQARLSDVIVISPGPGAPADAGHCLSLVKELVGHKPFLGVCLGHQVIVEAFGGKVGSAKAIVHGKTETLRSENRGVLAGLGKTVRVARYHSLAAINLPQALRVDAESADQEVMAVSHIEYPIYGLQFHPESIMTRNGSKILANFIELSQSNHPHVKTEGKAYAEFA